MIGEDEIARMKQGLGHLLEQNRFPESNPTKEWLDLAKDDNVVKHHVTVDCPRSSFCPTLLVGGCPSSCCERYQEMIEWLSNQCQDRWATAPVGLRNARVFTFLSKKDAAMFKLRFA